MLHHRTTANDRPDPIIALHCLDLPNAPVTPAFDRLTQLASRLLGSAVALVALRNEDRHSLRRLQEHPRRPGWMEQARKLRLLAFRCESPPAYELQEISVL